MRVIYDIVKRKLISMTELINSINNGSFNVITPEEWEIITETIECRIVLTQGTKPPRRRKLRR
jgi:hypothetical protein